MKCPGCGFDNKADKKFCTKCGAKLFLKCPKCGAEVEKADDFCGVWTQWDWIQKWCADT